MDPPGAPGVRKFRDLWQGGMPLARAARHAGLTLSEAEAVMAATTTDHPPASPSAEELRGLYVDERLTAVQVGDRLGLTVHQVRHRLEKAGIRRPASPGADEVVRLYREGHSTRAVAALLGMQQRKVWQQLKDSGTPLRPVGIELTVLSRTALEQLYVRGGLSLRETAERFDVTRHVVARNLERYGIPRHQPAVVERDVLQSLYVDASLGTRTVAARLGVTEGQVRRSLARHGIPIRRPGRPANLVDRTG
jgi:DNA-binding CsgD family transcriptional regulator